MVQKLTSELVLKLSQNVSGPAAEARKALEGVNKALAAIGERKAAEERLNKLTSTYDKARTKVRELGTALVAAEKPTKAAMDAYARATKNLDQLTKSIETQKQAVLTAEQNTRGYIGATESLAAAEARLKEQATTSATALVEASEKLAREQRMQRSLLKEIERSANEQAAANQRAAEQTRRAELEKTAAVEREAQKRREALAREAAAEAEQARKAAEEQRKAAQRAEEQRLADAKKFADQQTAIARKAAEQRKAAVDEILGAAYMITGMKMTEGGRGMVEAGAQLEANRNRLRNVSNSEDEVSAADAVASKVMAAYPLTSKAESIGDWIELRSMATSSDPSKPIDLAKQERNVMLMAQTRSALAASGYHLEDSDAKALAQALEGSGRAMDPAGQRKMLDAYVRAKQVYGNAITSASVRDFVMNAKAANFSAADDSFFFTTFARLAQGNPSRLGNEFAQTMNTLVGGHMTKQGANWLADLGLIDKHQIKNGEGGKFYIEGGLKQADLLSTDQTAWAQQVLMQGLVHSGALTDDKIKARMAVLEKSSPGADEKTLEERAVHGLLADAIMKSGFRSTVTDNLIHAIANEYLTEKDVEQMRTAKGLGAADTLGQNPIAAFDELTTAIENFGSVLSAPVMKDAASIMHGLASGLSDLSASLEGWQKDHPKTAETVGAAVPAALVGAGGWLTWFGTSKILRGLFARGASGAAAGAAAGGAPAAAAAAGGGFFANLLRLAAPFVAPELAATATTKEEDETLSRADAATARLRRQHGDAALMAARRRYQPWWKRSFSPDASDADDAEYMRRYLEDLNDSRGSDVRERAGSPAPDAWGASGFKLEAPQVDLGKQSAVVIPQAQQLMAAIQSIFGVGVDVPIRIDSSAVQAAARSAKADADAKAAAMLRSTYADVETG